jgi:hypothetical protein
VWKVLCKVHRFTARFADARGAEQAHKQTQAGSKPLLLESTACAR